MQEKLTEQRKKHSWPEITILKALLIVRSYRPQGRYSPEQWMNYLTIYITFNQIYQPSTGPGDPTSAIHPLHPVGLGRKNKNKLHKQ